MFYVVFCVTNVIRHMRKESLKDMRRSIERMAELERIVFNPNSAVLIYFSHYHLYNKYIYVYMSKDQKCPYTYFQKWYLIIILCLLANLQISQPGIPGVKIRDLQTKSGTECKIFEKKN